MAETKKRLRTMHISAGRIWDMGKGKGRISTYLPLKALCDRAHGVLYLTNHRKQEAGIQNGLSVRKIVEILSRSDRKTLDRFIRYFHLPFFIVASVFQSLLTSPNYKPDLVFGHSPYCAIPAFIVSKMTHSRYVLRLYGIDQKTYNRAFLYILFKLPADLYIVTNDGTSGEKTLKEYGIDLSRMCFWVNGIDKRWASKLPDAKFRTDLSPNNEKIVLSVSRLEDWKQVDIILKAIPQVIMKCKNVKFIIVGDGDQRQILEDMARDLGVSDFVRFEGAVKHSKVIDYTNACDLLISMNALSSINNPVLEAMTCGRAVIGLNTGTTSALIKHDVNGLLLEVNEIDRLPEFIVSLLKDDELRERIGQNAQKFMLDNWPTWEQRVGLEVDIIESLCSSDRERFAEIKEKADRILDMRKWV